MTEIVSARKISSEIKVIRLVREQKKITRDEIAKALGVSFKTIEGIENGRIPLSDERRLELLKFLELSEKEVLRIKKTG